MTFQRLIVVQIILFFAGVCAVPATADDWPRFRGPNGSGVSDDTMIPTTWSDSNNLKWKTKMPGRGFSSPIVVGNRVFVTCYTGNYRNLSTVKRHLLCINRKTGDIIWSKPEQAKLPEFRTSGQFAYHGYASSTPVSDGERVYVHYGTTGVIAYDANGKELWRKNVGTQQNSFFGSGTSPMLWKDNLIVTAGAESATMRAFDKKTGKENWKIEQEGLSGTYCTPVVGKNKQGKDELIIAVPYEVWGVNPKTGEITWYVETDSGGTFCSSVVVKDDLVYAAGGGGKVRPACTAVRIGGKDDVTKTNVVWAVRGVGPYVPSAVLYKEHLYWVDNRGILTCVNAKNGKEVGRTRLGAAYASPIVINGKIYAVTRYDGIYVLEASPKLTRISLNTFTSDESDFSGTPAVSNGQLFIRSDAYLYCIEGK